MRPKSWRCLRSPRFPLTQPWFLGLANIRGNLYSVVDLAGFLGRETVVPHGTSGQAG
jgi:twitching motility protein PilI